MEKFDPFDHGNISWNCAKCGRKSKYIFNNKQLFWLCEYCDQKKCFMCPEKINQNEEAILK